MRLKLWYLNSTSLAYLVSTTPKVSSPGHESIWIPRSICRYSAKKATEEGELPSFVVEVQDWFIQKKPKLQEFEEN